MAHTVISPDFQVVIPEEIRETASLTPGQEIRIDFQEGVITMIPTSSSRAPADKNPVRSLFAAWKEEDSTLDQQEIDSRTKDLESFKESMNNNRSSERRIYP